MPQPFASRPLAPLLAQALAAAARAPVETGFVVLGWISLLFALLVVFGLVVRTAAPRWILLAMAAVPFWPQLLHGLALPDLPYTALLCVFLLFLEADRPSGAALLLFPLMVARESTMLTLAWPAARGLATAALGRMPAGGRGGCGWIAGGAAFERGGQRETRSICRRFCI